MPARRPSTHHDVLARRLALLNAEAEPSPIDLAPRVPIPGRHAARRGRTVPWLGDGVVPATLRGRISLGPAQVAVVAILVALGLAATTWWVVRADADPVVDLSAAPTQAGAPLVGLDAASGRTLAPGAEASDSAPGTVTVDVAGKVRRPGIAVLAAGARVIDALDAAGGPRRGVELDGINLARVLVDGEQILVGVPAVGGIAAAASAASPAPGALVNLNTAGEAELDTLPQVGPVTAGAILAWRQANGGFSSVDELLEVEGIGEVTLARIAPHVTV